MALFSRLWSKVLSEARELLREIVGTVRARHTDHLIAKFERSKFYL
jgi:hypothetical protein